MFTRKRASGLLDAGFNEVTSKRLRTEELDVTGDLDVSGSTTLGTTWTEDLTVDGSSTLTGATSKNEYIVDYEYSLENDVSLSYEFRDANNLGKDSLPNGSNGMNVTPSGVIQAEDTTNNRVYAAWQSRSINNRIELDTSLFHGVETYSISAWIRWTGGSGIRAIFVAEDVGADFHVFYVTPGENVTFQKNGTGAFQCSALISPLTGQWVHVVATFTKSEVNIYANGALEDTDTSGGGNFWSFNDFPVNAANIGCGVGPGGSGTGTWPYADDMDSVQFFLGKELSAGEVATLYNQGTATSDLVVYQRGSTTDPLKVKGNGDVSVGRNLLVSGTINGSDFASYSETTMSSVSIDNASGTDFYSPGQTVDIKLVKVGRMVNLQIPYFIGDTTAAGTVLIRFGSLLPVGYRPSTNVCQYVGYTEGGTRKQDAILSVETFGRISIDRTDGTAWPASTTIEFFYDIVANCGITLSYQTS